MKFARSLLFLYYSLLNTIYIFIMDIYEYKLNFRYNLFKKKNIFLCFHNI